eukprot:1389262-Rhodomonas_salina.1
MTHVLSPYYRSHTLKGIRHIAIGLMPYRHMTRLYFPMAGVKGDVGGQGDRGLQGPPGHVPSTLEPRP